MPAPRPPYRRTALDHIAEALTHLEAAVKAVERIDTGAINPAGRVAVEQLHETLGTAKVHCADSIDALIGRGSRPSPTTPPSAPPATPAAKPAAAV